MESRQRNKRQRDGLTDELALEGLEVASAGKKQYKHGRYTNKEMEILKQGYVMIAMVHCLLDADAGAARRACRRMGWIQTT